MRRNLISLAILLVGSWQTRAIADDPASLAGARAEVYKSIGDVQLMLHTFEPAGHSPSARSPAIVFFFGGGWKSGTPKQFAPHCRYLSQRGMVAIVADYRVQSRHETTPFECVKDGKSAVRWIRANAQRLGVDPHRIAAGGGSAGGQVAAATGTLSGLEEPGEDLQISSQPDALVLFNPVYDNGPTGYGYDRVQDRYEEISPLHNIRAGAPPTIVFLGTKDQLIPVSTAHEYERRMQAIGSRCETRLFPGASHGFFNYGRNDNQYYRETVALMDEFLVSLGWIAPVPEYRLLLGE